ncbi:unnamed protein product [Ectocarpus sp. CCAP 1310/34]|nr:unnamed protein product [Ectocarpus sp. CCAP 1310/34]
MEREKRHTSFLRFLFLLFCAVCLAYHHGFDAEVKVPETNTKKHNVDLLRMFGAKSIRVRRKEGEQGVVEYNFEVPTEPGSSFPAGNRDVAVYAERR